MADATLVIRTAEPDDLVGTAHPVFPWLFATSVTVGGEAGIYEVEYEAPRVALRGHEEITRWARRRRQGKR